MYFRPEVNQGFHFNGLHGIYTYRHYMELYTELWNNSHKLNS